MDENNDLHREIASIFDSVQLTSARHQKSAVLLRNLAEKNDLNAFMDGINNILQHILTGEYKCKNVYLERSIDFLALFVASLKPQQEGENGEEVAEHPVLKELFQCLIQAQENALENVRFWSCVVLGKILDNMKELSEDLLEELQEAMLERVNDTKVAIRLQAIICVHRLQDPTNPRDPIIAKFVPLIETDSSPKVRKLCLEKMAARHDTLPRIIGRTRDVDENVRMAAFNRLQNLAPKLSIAQKRAILQNAYMDTSEKILKFISMKFVPKWLEMYDNDYMKLIAAVRFDADENDIKETALLVQDILETLFKSQPLNEIVDALKVNDERLLPIENLNWESSIFWRLLIEHLRTLEFGEDILVKILPELVHFCNYIRSVCARPPSDFLQYQFILKQLFLITSDCDVSDTASRQALTALISEILQKSVLVVDVAEVIFKNLEKTIPDTEKRCLFFCEIVSNIKYDIDSDQCEKQNSELNYKMSKIHVDLNCLTDELKRAVEEENFAEAERVNCLIMAKKTEITNMQTEQKKSANLEKKTDMETILKYLTIIEAFLKSSKIKRLNASLLTLKDTVIQEVLIHPDPTVMAKAMTCYGLCCIVDKLTAQNGIHLFSKPILAYQAGEECPTDILVICIKLVVDLVRVFGSSLISECDHEDLSESRRSSHLRIFVGNFLSDLIEGLMDLMDDEQSAVQEQAFQGLCILLLEERVHSSQLLARLILKWCNPANKDKDLRHKIGHCLQIIPKVASHNQYLEDAVLGTVKTIVEAPRSSPLYEADLDDVAKFLAVWCGTALEGRQIQTNLTTKICYEMKNKPRRRINQVFSKMLQFLALPEDDVIVKEIWHLCHEIDKVVGDKLVLNNIRRYLERLKASKLNFSAVEEETVLSEINEN